MEPSQALADLTEISTQVTAAVILDPSGGVLASTVTDEARAAELARKAGELLAAAEAAGSRLADTPLVQLQVALRSGSAFVVREGGRTVAATTTPEPTAGLVFYDLRSCLRNLDDGGPPLDAAA